MSITVLCSAGGAPGTTTTALALALASPTPSLLVESADSGSSSVMAGYLRGQIPEPYDVLGFRGRSQAEQRERITEWSVNLPDSQARCIPVAHGPGEGRHGVPEWHQLLATLRELERDEGLAIYLDLGRFRGAPGHLVSMASADQVLLVLQSTLPSLAAARVATARIVEGMEAADSAAPDSFGLCIVGPGQPFTQDDVSAIAQAPVVGTVANDPVAAEVLSLGAKAGPSFNRSPFNRSIHILRERLQSRHHASSDGGGSPERVASEDVSGSSGRHLSAMAS